jgi:putative NADPH-quinone reductase
MKTLLIAGHPDLSQSVVNATILDEIARALPDVRTRRLCRTAQDGVFDVPAEQAALAEANLIVWQFPFHWYSLPWLMKKWLDEVFVHGFAHGTGARLAGKKLLVSFTTGAPAAAYTGESGSIADIRELVSGFPAIAKACALDYLGPIWLNGVSYAARDDAEAVARQQALAREYAARLIARIREIQR